MSRTVLGTLVLAASALRADPPEQPAQGDLRKGEKIAEGLVYGRYEKDDEKRKFIAHVIRMDLKSKDFRLRSIKAKGTETIRQMVQRMGDESVVLAGINGDFFRQETSAGFPYGLQVSDGRLIFGPMRRSMIGFGPQNEPYIGVVSLDARISFAPPAKRGPPARWTQINEINPVGVALPSSASGIHLYTPAFLGMSRNSPRGLIAVVEAIQPALQVGDVCEGKVARIESSNRPMEVPEAGCLLYFFGGYAKELWARVKPGQTVAIKVELPPIVGGVSQAIGGGPRLLRDGKKSVETSKESFESFQAYELAKRHPRSAIGFDQKKTGLYLVMVEGRHPGSQGMTFGELADFMAELGCWQAMGFDGGGSAGLYVEGKGFVSRSMGGFGYAEERQVSNGLLITREKSPPGP